MPSNRRKAHFCRAPFEKIEIAANGDVHLCCPGWLPMAIGNLNKQTLVEIWKGEKAGQVRDSVRDGRFGNCSATQCPHLQTLDHMAQPSLKSPIEAFAAPSNKDAELIAQGVVPDLPQAVNAVFDLTCNLSCPSCRREPIVFRPGTRQWQQSEKFANEVIQLLPKLRRLKIAGNGEPFASRLYWKILMAIDRQRHPELRVYLHSSGLGFTADKWKELSKAHGLISTVEISIDACEPATYAMNRRGGSFETLIERLQLISKLRQENSIGRLILSFVVQANNFREMRGFVELGRSLKADMISFARLDDWGSFPVSILSSRSVHHPEHLLHNEFKTVLSDPIFSEPDVFLGNLNEFRSNETTSSPGL